MVGATDVFSLGSVLAFAAAGAAPFGSSGTEMFAIAYRVVNGEPDLSRVPASLRPLIDACLAKDPAARPSDSQLILDVTVGAATRPEITPGRFWPDEVSAVLESSSFTPVLRRQRRHRPRRFRQRRRLGRPWRRRPSPASGTP